MANQEPSALPFVVHLDGISNLRDIGGYRTTDGRTVRRHLVFRSAALAKLTDADITALAPLGLQTICDFRGVDESKRAPTPLTTVRILPLPIEPTVGVGLRDILQTNHATGEALYAVLQRAYAAYALDSQAQFGAMLDQVMDGATPLLFHCSAGKDRTGFGAALLLTMLGVPWDTVIADFEATNRLWRRDTVPADDIPPDIQQSLLHADPALLQTAFDAARESYGSLATYYEAAFGFGPDRIQRLQDIMLQDE